MQGELLTFRYSWILTHTLRSQQLDRVLPLGRATSPTTQQKNLELPDENASFLWFLVSPVAKERSLGWLVTATGGERFQAPPAWGASERSWDKRLVKPYPTMSPCISARPAAGIHPAAENHQYKPRHVLSLLIVCCVWMERTYQTFHASNNA